MHYYAAVGDVTAAFLLGQRLGPHHPGMSVVRSSQLQWQQLADANVLFLGRKVKEIEEMLRSRQVVAGSPKPGH